jgi:hypothetical protein
MVHVHGQVVQICKPFFIRNCIPWLMCPSIILHVVEAVAFELRQIQLLDGRIVCQLENDYVVVEGESSTKLLLFFI